MVARPCFWTATVAVVEETGYLHRVEDIVYDSGSGRSHRRLPTSEAFL